jgi:ADP-L-glycero-D-manno-heptose 6-epimerase
MKLLITGSEGFIGKNFIKAIPRAWNFDCFDIKNNLNVRPKHLSVKKYDWVIHLGAISSTTESNLSRLMDLNLSWTVELFEECKKHNCNLQWSSSASVYGKRSRSAGVFKETDQCMPSNYYAMSKYLIEQYIKCSSYDITVQGFRYFNVYGEHEEHKQNQASPYTQFKQQAQKTGIINIFEGSDVIYRDFVHVDSVVAAHLKMLNSRLSGIYNIGSGQAKSFLEVASSIASDFSAQINIIPFPEHLKSHYQYYTEADMTLLSNTLRNEGIL